MDTALNFREKMAYMKAEEERILKESKKKSRAEKKAEKQKAKKPVVEEPVVEETPTEPIEEVKEEDSKTTQ